MGFAAFLKTAFLAQVLPNNEPRWVALLIQLPHGNEPAVEASDGGYKRVVQTKWLVQTEGDVVLRVNADTLTFPVLQAPLFGVVGVGIYDAEVEGQLLWSAPLRTMNQAIVTVDVQAGEEPRFLPTELRVGMGAW